MVDKQQRKGIFYGWWILVAAFLIMTFLYAPIANLISIFTVPVTEELGIGRTQFTTYYTIMSLVAMVTAPIAGGLMRKIDIRVYLTLFTVLGAISFIGFSFAKSIMYFYIFSIPMGAALAGAAMIPVSVLITNWFNEKRGLSLGIALSGTGVGGAIYSPVSTWIITDYGWRTAYLVIGVVILVLLVPLALFVIKLTPADKGLLPLGELPIANGAERKVLLGVTQKEAFKSVSYWVFCLAIIVAGIVVNSMIIHFVPYLTDIGTSMQTAALLLSISSIMVIVSKLTVGKFYDKLGLLTTLLIICGGSLVSFLLLFKGDILIVALLYTAVAAFGATAVTVTPAYLTGALYGEKEYSAKYGTVSLFNSLGAAIAPIVAGLIYNINQSYGILIYTLIILAVVEFILFFIAIKTKPKFSQNISSNQKEAI